MEAAPSQWHHIDWSHDAAANHKPQRSLHAWTARDRGGQCLQHHWPINGTLSVGSSRSGAGTERFQRGVLFFPILTPQWPAGIFFCTRLDNPLNLDSWRTRECLDLELPLWRLSLEDFSKRNLVCYKYIQIHHFLHNLIPSKALSSPFLSFTMEALAI